jgi:hypothetical protein
MLRRINNKKKWFGVILIYFYFFSRIFFSQIMDYKDWVQIIEMILFLVFLLMRKNVSF